MAYQELKGHRDLKVFQLAYKLAMDIFNISKAFPKEEKILSYRPDTAFLPKCGSKYCRRISKEAISKNVCEQTRGLRRRSD